MAVPPGGNSRQDEGTARKHRAQTAVWESPGYGESYKGNTSREAETTYGLYGRG